MKKTVRKKQHKRIAGLIMAGIMLLGAAGGILLSYKNTAYAKETLQAIEKVVEQSTAKKSNGEYKDPFVILEIVPDFVTVSMTVDGLDEKGEPEEKTVDVPFNIGSAGFYVKGQEPVHRILAGILGDDADGTATVLNDSKSRRNLSNKAELDTVGIGYLVSDTNSEAIFFNDDPAGYKELRLGEIMQYQHDCNKDGKKETYKEATPDLMKKLVNDSTFYAINHDYTGKNGDAYIDVAEGIMKKASDGKGNYTLTYEPKLTEDEENEKLDTDEDAAYIFVNTMTDGPFAMSADREGVYDPLFVAKEGTEATHRAAFAYVKGAASGYEVKSSEQILEDDTVADGTPLYTYDVDRNIFLFAGFAKNAADGKLTAVATAATEDVVGLAYPEIPHEEEEEPEDGEGDGDDNEIVYYSLSFQYVNGGSGGSYLYQVSYFDKNDVAEYAINTDKRGAIVPNANGTGVIKLGDTDSIAEQLIYDYTQGKGLFHWTSEAWLSGADSANAGIYRIRGAKIYFSTGLINRDLFKKNVFDLEAKECDDMPVIVKTIPASKVTVKDVQNSKLLIFQGGEMTYGGMDGEEKPVYERGGNDISFDVLTAIVGRVVEEDYPVVSDYSLFPESWDNKTDLTAENPPNAYYLTRTLLLKDMDRYYKNVLKSGIEPPVSNPTQYGNPITLGGHNNVNKSVQNVTFGDYPNGGFLNSNFVNPVSNDEGYKPVLEDIKQENVVRAASGKKGRIKEIISQATIIRYIIAYSQKESYEAKGSLHILELAPAASFTLRLETKGEDKKTSTLYKITETNQAGEITAKEELIKIDSGDVTLTQMTTAEYIGHVEDINAHYDLVYIGSRIGPYKLSDGTLVKMNQDANGKTVYNDTSMNGLIYSNIGDIFGTKGISMKAYTNTEIARFSGNDITEEKQKALTDFMDAGFPVVVSDELVNVRAGQVDDNGKAVLTVNKDTVDNCSYLYSFLNDNKGKENFFRLSEMSAPLLGMYLNVSRPYLSMLSDSLAKASQEHVQTLTKDSNGNYRAVYEFKVDNIGVGNGDATYDFELFIDINSDGKFSTTTEEITQFELTDTAGNDVSTDDSGRYQLSAGNTYRATYVISEEHRGVMPWKVRIIRNDDTNLKRADAIGYYEIKNPDDKYERIRVLQIDTASTTQERLKTWNMEETMKDPKTIFSQLINNKDAVPFDVTIDTIPSDKLTVAYTEEKLGKDGAIVDINKDGNLDREEYLSFMRTYDMIVTGFADCVIAPPDIVVEALKIYAEEGRSVLFTHDTTSAYTYEGQGWAYKYNQILRNTFGMDRYNAWNDRDRSDEETFQIETPYKPKSGKGQTVGENQGFVYPMMQRKWDTGRNDKVMLDGMAKGGNSDYDWNQWQTTTVEPINSGQITMYPYELDKKPFTVARTHGQYWQLDFTKDDDKDGESDLVVWYTLGGTDIYKKSPRDVRNNYYIYNMGNITYSGVGHSSVMGESGTGEETINEIKLFINTLVASYESGLHAPEVRIIENYNPDSRDLNSIYLSYDEQLKSITNDKINTGIIDAKENVYFVAKSTSLIRNTNIKSHSFSANLYVEVPTLDGAETLNFREGTVYGRKIPIEGLFRKGSNGEEIEIAPNPDGSYPIESGVGYRARVPVAALRYYSNGTTVFDETDAALPTDGSVNARNSRRIFVAATEKIRNIRSGIETEANAMDSASVVRVHVFDMD